MKYLFKKRNKVHYIYAYENSITKTTKHCLKKEEGGEKWKYNGGVELVQSTLNACIELSQSNFFILLMYANLKIKQKENRQPEKNGLKR
jgi:hypothetical protein